jgi:hypothetical protein
MDVAVKDWPGGVTAISDVVSLGVSNNHESLFLALVVLNSNDNDEPAAYARSLAAGGLTVWMDPHGSDRRIFGIHFQGMEESGAAKPDTDAPGSTNETTDQTQSSDLAVNGLTLMDTNCKTTQTTAQALRACGFEARTSYSRGRFIYVMKLPLHSKDHSPFPSALASSKAVGFGFEGKDFKVHKPGGGSGGGSGNVTEKFNVWVSVDLGLNQPPDSKTK